MFDSTKSQYIDIITNIEQLISQYYMLHERSLMETEYLSLAKKIMNEGSIKNDRTLTGTKSIF